MYKHISSNELWDKICHNLSFPNSPLGIHDFKHHDEFGQFKLTHYNTGYGIKYSYFVADFYQNTILENKNSFNTHFLCFNTGKQMVMEDALKCKKVKLDADICWNGSMNEGHQSNSFYFKNQQAMTHNITFDHTLFKEITLRDEKFKNLKLVYKGDYIDVNFNNHVNVKQKILLNDIINVSKLDNKLQMLYLESKLLDLVYTTFNAIETDVRKEEFYLNHKDIECLYKAKQILIENIQAPPSLKELSYKAAINEFKLKKGFKQLFNTTVYGFLQNYRLCQAKELLEHGEINIGEASALVGYKSISHFSKIFKEQFGITPIQIKKESKTRYTRDC